MSEPFHSDWNAVRASLELPKKDRFAAIDLPDEIISEKLQWAAGQLNSLVEYGVDEKHPAAKELVALMDRIAKLAGVPAVSIPFRMGLEIGGDLKPEEEQFRNETLNHLRLVLRSIFEDMIAVDTPARAKRDSLIALSDLNEAREQQEAAKLKAAAAREAKVAHVMKTKRIDRTEALRRIEADPFASINLERARELGLVREHVPAWPAAQEIIERIIDQSRRDRIDVTTPEGIRACAAAWERAAPGLPRPNDWYLQQLQAGKIISNLDVTKRKIVARPEFGLERDIFVDDWTEVDWDAVVSKGSRTRVLEQELISPLLAALNISRGSVVGVIRDHIDLMLWDGDPADRKKFLIHRNVIESLGLDPDVYYFRLIPQDIYARLAKIKQWGNSNLDTHFDEYCFRGVSVDGLDGGHRGHGGASRVGFSGRGHAFDSLAVRLVLECNK